MKNTLARCQTSRNRPAVYLAGAGLTAAMIFSAAVWAHSGATGVVKERMDMMKELGDNMKALKSLVRNRTDFDAEKVAELAYGIQEVSNHVVNKFPEGSNDSPSEALPAIWEDWDRFAGLIDQMNAEAARLGEVAGDGDQSGVIRQFASLGKTCRSCHTDFRKKKEK
jgi:cytochrome c556